MYLNFTDFKAPRGLFIATGTELLPLASEAGAKAFVEAAIRSGLFYAYT